MSEKYVYLSDLEAVVGLSLTPDEAASLIRLGLFPLPVGLDPACWKEGVLRAWRARTLDVPDGWSADQEARS